MKMQGQNIKPASLQMICRTRLCCYCYYKVNHLVPRERESKLECNFREEFLITNWLKQLKVEVLKMKKLRMKNAVRMEWKGGKSM